MAKSQEIAEKTTRLPNPLSSSTVLSGFKKTLKIHKYFVLVFAIGFLLRIPFILFPPSSMGRYRGDVKLYVRRSKSILEGKVPYRDFWDIQPPLWSYSLAAWFKLIGQDPSQNGVRAFIFIFCMLDILIIYLLAKNLFSQREGIIAALFFAVNPLDIFSSMMFIRYDAVPLFFALLSFYFLQKWRWKLSALILGIGIMFKYITALIFVPYLIYVWKNSEKESSKNSLSFLRNKIVWAYFLTVIGFCFAIALPFIIMAWDNYYSYTTLFARDLKARISIYGFIAHAYNYYHPGSDWIFELGRIAFIIILGFLLIITKKVLSKREGLDNITFVYLAFLWSALYISLSISANPPYFEHLMPWLGILVARYITQININKIFDMVIIASLIVPAAIVFAYLCRWNHFYLYPKSTFYIVYAFGVLSLDIPLFYTFFKYYSKLDILAQKNF